MNEQDKATYERVREQVAKSIHVTERLLYSYFVSEWEDIPERDKRIYLTQADQILHLPGIAVLADDQTLPEVDHQADRDILENLHIKRKL